MDDVVLKLILTGLSAVTVALIGFVAWMLKDYYKFRTAVVPNLVSRTECGNCQRVCQTAIDKTLNQIDTRLARGDTKFEKMTVMIARIGEKLGVEVGRDG